ncbi:hypothetical protein [Rahnella sp. ChDrAdgB13]|uniref:hypothetical protein n=1 Tax=Rahnella sp. ChDrAdgB13 TaxID=1850581 RepID=UPI001AD859C5|nr:hypothetical protein [Rahnella sp. ChDrAdgB13]
MTTIAWDGYVLAADTQATAGGIICSLKERKIFCPSISEKWHIGGDNVVALGCSGECGAEYELIGHLDTGLSYSSEFVPTVEFSALAIVARGKAYLIIKNAGDKTASISLLRDPYALGSGSTIAQTAMHCGESAFDAVRIAIEMDVYSGGKIDSFDASQ